MLFSLLHERILALLLPALLLPSKIFRACDLVQGLLVKAANVNFRRGGNDISCVDSSDRHAIDFKGTGYEQYAFLQVLEEYDSFAAESAGEEDEDSTRLQRGSRFGVVDSFTGLPVIDASVNREVEVRGW